MVFLPGITDSVGRQAKCVESEPNLSPLIYSYHLRKCASMGPASVCDSMTYTGVRDHVVPRVLCRCFTLHNMQELCSMRSVVDCLN